MTPVEYLSKDILEEDFLKCFLPYHILQQILGNCRVDPKNRFVTEPTRLQRLYTLCAMVMVLSFYYVWTYEYLNTLKDFPKLIFFYVTYMVVQTFIAVCNVLHSRFFNGSANVQFFIKMQQIERLLKIDRDSTLNTLQFKIHSISVFILILITIVFTTIGVSGGPDMIVLIVLITLVEAPFVLEISHCSNLMFFFAIRTRFVNAIILNHLDELKTNALLPIPTKDYNNLRSLVGKIHDFNDSDTDLFLREIIRCFQVYNGLYRFQILVYFTKIFVYSLLFFEYTILALNHNHFEIMYITSFSGIMILDYMTAFMLCIRFEIFIKSVKKTKSLAISITSIYVNGPLREKAKRMYKIIEEMPPCFSVYDMWTMEARMILTLLNIITGFLVTLLQFAIL